MASPYQPVQMPYAAPTPATATNPIGFNNTNDARKLAQNQRQYVAGQGDALQAQDKDLANQYMQQAYGTQSYLNPIMNTLATGGGGYNTGEQSQIMLSPQDKQNIITGAGISAGQNTAAAVGAAERAAAAAGGNPMALATYRARAARQQAADAGDAMTKARIAAQQAGSQGAQTVGNARMNQQQQGLNYYTGLQGQQSQNALAEQGLQHQAYGTETSGTGQAAGLGLQASQTPTTGDKIIGGITGVLGALADGGTSDYFDGGGEAVVGEDGPEIIIEESPLRPKFLWDGTAGGSGYSTNMDLPIASGDWGATQGASQMGKVSAPPQSFMSRLTSGIQNYLKQPATGGSQAAASGGQKQQQWNPTTPYQQTGAAIGNLAKLAFLNDGTASYMGDGGYGTAPYGPSVGHMLDGIPMAQPPQFEALEDRSYPPQEAIEGDEKLTREADDREMERYRANIVRTPKPAATNFADGTKGAGGGGNESWRAEIQRNYAPPIAKPPLPTALQGRPADVQADIDDTERAMRSRGVAEQANRRADPSDSRGFADWAHHDMQSLAESAMQKRRAPYASQHMADGGFPADDKGLPKAPTFNPSKLITSPTRVHLNKGDQVVPLTYRPKAKIRPSAALPALGNATMNPRLKHSFGAFRARA